jgi:pimeloyl-ACP methyl ester carboxylesterase
MSSRADLSHQDTPAWLAWALSTPGESGYVDVGGARLHYLSWNPGDVDKPALLLLHGFRGNAHWWDAVAPFFTERFRVIAFDLIGMGESDNRDHYTRRSLIDDLATAIRALELAPAICVGHSFGGDQALRVAEFYPELFTELVVIDTKLFMAGEPPPDALAPNTRRTYTNEATARSRFRLAPHQPDLPRGLMEHLTDHAVRRVAEGWTWKFDPALTPLDLGPIDGERLLGVVDRRVHYIYGSESSVVDADRARRIHGFLRHPGKLVCVPGGHHHVILDSPAAVVAALQALL